MVDLHIHSWHSDGSEKPEDIARMGAALGLTALALADHDCVRGLAAFAAACRAQGVRFVPGVELSTEFPGELHLLGYGIDPSAAPLAEILAEQAAERSVRNEVLLKKLAVHGLAVHPETPEGGALSLGHIAKALVDAGHVASIKEAFARYIGIDGSLYTPLRRRTPAQCLDGIHASGGLAVVAHPGSLRVDDIAAEVERLAALGLDGVELYYPTHRAIQMAQLSELVDRRGLLATTGSDFHGSFRPNAQLGCMAKLAALDARVEQSVCVILEQSVEI